MKKETTALVESKCSESTDLLLAAEEVHDGLNAIV